MQIKETEKMNAIKTTTIALLLAALPFAPITQASDRDYQRGGHESRHADRGHDHGYHRGHDHRHRHHWRHDHHDHHDYRNDRHYGHRVGVVLPLPLPPLPPVIILPGKHH
jgi:hypothetical protein